MAFKDSKFFKAFRIGLPLIFCASFLGAGAGIAIRRATDAKQKAKIDEYVNVLKASGEVGSIETECVLPFGDRQIVLTIDYTNAAKEQLEPKEYPLFLRSFYEPLENINNLKVGYNFSLTSEDGSFGLPTPKSNIPTVDWTVGTNLKDTAVGQWHYSKDAFSERYYYMQDPRTIAMINIPVGLETYVTTSNIDDLKTVTVYGKEYSTARLLANYKIVTHEILHSIGVGHVNSKMNIPRNEGGILETHMTTQLNSNFVGDSKFDNNTTIAATCLRKIISGSQNKNDKYFDPSHYLTFNGFMEKGRENLNNSNEKGQ